MKEPRPPRITLAQPASFSRRNFLAGAAALGAAAVTAGCAGTYDVGSGFTGTSGGANASTLVYWNLLTGGDGTHMVSMEDGFSKAYPKVNLESTILTWGNPYYTKLSLAIRSGSPPDVAIMHLSRIYEFGPPGMLTPLSPALLAAHGMQAKNFTPLAFSKARYGGQQLAIPLDTHPFVQYYNTSLCKKAGLLDSAGQLPPITSPQAMLGVLRKLKKIGATPAICDQVTDPATPWRLFYTLYSQAGGQVLADGGKKIVLDETLALKVLGFIYQLATEGLVNANTDPNGAWRSSRPATPGSTGRGNGTSPSSRRPSCRSACSHSRPCSAGRCPRPTRTRSSSHGRPGRIRRRSPWPWT